MAHGIDPPPDARAAQAGFTLIEVLVALAIVSFALAASARATALLAGTNNVLRERALAMVSAQNRMIEVQVDTALPATGTTRMPCPQGRLLLTCEMQVVAAPNNARLVTVEVYLAQRPQPRLATLRGTIDPR